MFDRHWRKCLEVQSIPYLRIGRRFYECLAYSYLLSIRIRTVSRTRMADADPQGTNAHDFQGKENGCLIDLQARTCHGGMPLCRL